MSADLKKKSKGKYGVEIWDLATGKPQCQFETGFRLTHLAFAPDGKSLAGASAQAQVRLYDAATGKQIRSSVLSGSVFTHLAYSPDGKSLYLADQDSVYRFDASTLMPTATFKAPISIGPRQFGFQPGGKVLALATAGRALHFWEATTGQLFSPKGLPTAAITDLRFTPEQTLFVACANGSASWWNPRAGDKLRDLKLNGKDRPAANSYPRGAPMFALSPAMHFIVGSNMNFGEFDLFDAKSGQKLFSERSKNGDFTLCFFDADRKVAVGSGKDIRVRDPRSGKELYRLELPVRQQEQLLRIEASPSGKRIAAFSFDQNTDFDRIFLWDVDQKKTMREWPVQDGFTAMRFSADEQWLGLGDGSGNLQLIDIGRGGRDRLLAAPETQRDWAVTDLAFSADGRQVAFAVGFPYSGRDSSRIYVFEMASKKLRLELPGHEAGTVARLAFSPDGAVLASGASDTTVLTWKAGLRAFIDPRATAVPQPGDLDAWFARLADSDAKAAFQAMIKMAQAPAHAVKCLEARIEPARAPELAGPLPQMIRELGSNTFAVRNKAYRALHKLGAAVEPDLREAMKGADLEMHRRIEVLLDSILNREWTAEELRHARAVEVLHAIASPEARALLTRWAGGDPFAILTGEARKALALR
jgi:WD40 repeat protein